MTEESQTQEETKEISLDLEFKPEIFDPYKDQLQQIADQVASIEVDPAKMDKDTLELVKTTKNKLVKARTTIQKIGKAHRDPATKYAKEVKAYEDSLLAILAPQEARMKEIDKAAAEKAMRDERMKTLPEFKAKLASIGDGIEETDENLLDLDPTERDTYYNGRLTAKNEADRAAIDKEKEEAAAEKAAMAEKSFNLRLQQILPIGFKEVGVNFVYSDELVIGAENLRLMEDPAFDKWLGEVKTFITAAEAEKAKAEKDAKAAEEKFNARLKVMLEIGFKSSGDTYILEAVETETTLNDAMILGMSDSDFTADCEEWKKLAEAKKAFDLKVAADAATKAAEDNQKKEAQEKRDEEVKARIEKLTSLGMTYSYVDESYVKDDFNVADIEVKLKSPEEWTTLISKIETEMTRRSAVAETEKKQAEESFQNWLVEMSYDEKTDQLVEKDGVTTMLRWLGSYDHNAEKVDSPV